MDLQELTKFLSERQSYLWAGLSTAAVFVVLRKNGLADGLENSVVTGVIAGGVLFVPSGYVGVRQGIPGNVLLALSVQ